MSAVGNVLSLQSPLEGPEIIKYLNHDLENIFFHGYAHVSEDFNPRYARERWYRYLLPIHLNEQGSHCIFSSGKSIGFDLQVARDALVCFHGEHDFTSFSKYRGNKDPIRRIFSTSVEVEEIITGLPPVVIIDIKGESFLWMMIRNMIGAMMAILGGSWPEHRIKEMLQNPGAFQKPTPAPATPLLLMDVAFPSIRFRTVRAISSFPKYLDQGFAFLPVIEIIRHMSKGAADKDVF